MQNKNECLAKEIKTPDVLKRFFCDWAVSVELLQTHPTTTMLTNPHKNFKSFKTWKTVRVNFLSRDGCFTQASNVSYRALIRYSARLMLAWEPVMVTCLSVEPSTGLAILIWAPDIWRISLIFAPWRPMMHPMSWEKSHQQYESKLVLKMNK